MAIIKCKMCGGDIELAEDKTFGTCEYCGSTMTLPKVDDDQRAAAFNRGNHFRRIGEFDKALAVYERIVAEDDNDAEAHWCCALCRFGIEYVEDPSSYEWKPTCHRLSLDSFLEDVDYLAAVEYSDGTTRRQYQKDAAKIAEVQRGILATSQTEAPFDVFICYKETDENGERTRDSLLAQDIYYQLTDQGRRVFFARITLEDKAGTEYEPYIFAALNSARVMVVVGTKAEYLNAVWVKNEWSRYLALMKKDRSRLLIPCFRDMDPYDLPEQLSVLQSYDMSKIGFIQDLTRGIAKVMDAEKKPESVKQTVVVQGGNANLDALLKRGFLALEDGDWNKAREFFDQALNLDAENAEAYVGLMMAELQVRTRKQLADQSQPFDGNGNYKKALRFGEDKLKAEVEGYIAEIDDRLQKKAEEERKRKEEERKQQEEARREVVYNEAVALSEKTTSKALGEARQKFLSIPGWKDADERAVALPEMIEAAKAVEESAEQLRLENVRKNNKYVEALTLEEQGSIGDLAQALVYYREIPGWKDADERADALLAKIEKAKAVQKTKCDALNQEKTTLQRELARLKGLFTGRRRKEIEARLAEIEAEIAKMK